MESNSVGRVRCPYSSLAPHSAHLPLTFHEDLQVDLAMATVAVRWVHDVAVVEALILELHIFQCHRHIIFAGVSRELHAVSEPLQLQVNDLHAELEELRWTRDRMGGDG